MVSLDNFSALEGPFGFMKKQNKYQNTKQTKNQKLEVSF